VRENGGKKMKFKPSAGLNVTVAGNFDIALMTASIFTAILAKPIIFLYIVQKKESELN